MQLRQLVLPKCPLYKCGPGPGLLLRILARLQSTRREQLGETVGHHVYHFEYLRYD